MSYSKTPLVQKLGIRKESEIVIINPPPGYEATLGKLPEGVVCKYRLKNGLRFVQCFAVSRSELIGRIPRLRQSLSKDGSLWISWPKKKAGRPTDLDENEVRRIGLANGLVDVKVCAVDDVWSGLKFVFRTTDRG